jgi:hypothetical protein
MAAGCLAFGQAIGSSSAKRRPSPLGPVTRTNISATQTSHPSRENERITLSEAHIFTHLLPAPTNAILRSYFSGMCQSLRS